MKSIYLLAPTLATILFFMTGCQSSTNIKNNFPAEPELILLSPQGGEEWSTGTTQKITWETHNIPSGDLIAIHIRRILPDGQHPADGQEFDPVLFADLENNGEKKWNIPYDIYPDGDYMIEVVSYKSTPVTESVSDQNDAPFTIKNLDHIGDSSRQVSLYYYNLDKDKEIADYIPCSSDAVMPVIREIPLSDNLPEDTINLLLQGHITPEEQRQGFQTEFPHPDFKLQNSELKDGILKLTFTEVPGFTDGGSCRIGLLVSQIRKTAEQFPEVREVQILPEELFQP